ncbi:MAG TPA: hypothetical protein VLU25_11050 [Acidobacteriota bacterium]|nr:hypothetical protein [Acidobacteriota bacterium]
MADVFASMPFSKDFVSVWRAIQDVATKHDLSSYRVEEARPVG